MSSKSKLSSSETSPAKEKVANEDSSKDDALFVGNADSSKDNARFLPCLMWGGCDEACFLQSPLGVRRFPNRSMSSGWLASMLNRQKQHWTRGTSHPGHTTQTTNSFDEFILDQSNVFLGLSLQASPEVYLHVLQWNSNVMMGNTCDRRALLLIVMLFVLF